MKASNMKEGRYEYMQTTYSTFNNGQHVAGATMVSHVRTSQTGSTVNLSIDNTNFGSSQIPGTRSYDMILERLVNGSWVVVTSRTNLASPHVGSPLHVTFSGIGIRNASTRIRIHSYKGLYDSSNGRVYRHEYITSHTTPRFLR